MSKTPRLLRRERALFNVGNGDLPHLIVRARKLVITWLPIGAPWDLSRDMGLDLHHQKGRLMYHWLSTNEREHRVLLPDGGRVMTGGFFELDYREGLRPWPQHVERLTRMAALWKFAREPGL